jgi:DNA-binding beta-propeller fold protein YncE
MLTRVKVFSLTIAALLVLTLVPGAPFGYPSASLRASAWGRPTTAAPPEPLNTLSNTEATEAHFSDSSAPSVSSVVQAPTADAENVELVGHIGGPALAVAVQEAYAYTGEGLRLTILDISNAGSPTVVGKTVPMLDDVVDVAVAGDYAYVADLGAGLRVVDVSDPANPTEVRYYDTPGYANDVAVAPAGDYVYVADRGLCLRCWKQWLFRL